MKKIFCIIVPIYLIFGIFGIANAKSFKMTGENDKLIFNIEKIINFESQIKIPIYSAIEQKIEGNFWIKEIGPVKMNINVSCYGSKICKLTGKGINQTIGEIDFGGGSFDNSKKIFGGKIKTNIGDLSLEKISLGENWDLEKKNFEANENIILKLDKNFGEKNIEAIVNSTRYIGKGDEIKVSNLTKSGDYNIKITIDGESKNFTITINPGNIEKIEIKQEGSNYAGGEKKLIFKPKDKFGNNIQNGKIGLKITSTASSNPKKLKNIQDQSNIVISEPNFINNNGIKEFDLKNGKVEVKIKSATISLYKEILLKEITFNGKIGDFGIKENDKKIIFENPIKIETNNEEIYHDQKHNLNIKLKEIKNAENIKNVKILVEYATIDSKNEFNITDEPTNYINQNEINKKSVWKELDFGGNLGQKNIESIIELKNKNETNIKTEINIFAQYTTNITGEDKIITIPIKKIEKEIKIENTKNPESLKNFSNNTKSQIQNIARKNISILKRNINNFDNKNYLISSNNLEINDLDSINSINSINNKESYITIGADIIINKNINNTGDKPIAFIATSSNGKGGNILIAENVTNLEGVVLMADKIGNYNDNNKNKQLYIFGSVFADNGCLDSKNDCLPKLRESYTGAIENMATGDIAKKYKHSKIILQYNPKLQTNPPIGLAEIIQ